MDPVAFAAKWKASTLTERAAAQSHFSDICAMLGLPSPTEADPTGEFFTFERGASKAGGGEGWADVWKRDMFAMEYKGKGKDLAAAYHQLLGYKDALDSPPILAVCDLNRFEIHTSFTNTPSITYRFDLDDIAIAPDEPLRILRAMMTDPEELKPRGAAEELTAAAAGRFAELAQALRGRGEDPYQVARFLDRLLFLLFAEDTNVLPRGLLGRLMEATEANPDIFASQLSALFSHISAKGGFFGTERVPWINGSLFTGGEVLRLTKDEIKLLIQAGLLDWSKLEPSIFGTLFERGLDPGQRSAMGAHFTGAADIERVVEPVVMAPLRREAYASRAAAAQLLEKGGTANRNKAMSIHEAYVARLRSVRVLDPACGSGNFLYVALRKLKDLEHEQALWASSAFQIPIARPEIGPQSVLGLEINPYAAELARLVIWIGDLQWQIAHNFGHDWDPVLKPLDDIRTGDALIDLADPTHPVESEWPAAEFIIGNPPFLGDKLMAGALGRDYTDALRTVFLGRLPGQADLAAYWHEKARAQIAAGKSRRAGLLATQGIRGGLNRRVLERIKESGDIFLAVSDQPWVLDGAMVHISIVGQDDGTETARTLDGMPVPWINANLTTGVDVTRARRLAENAGICWLGSQKAGPFDITGGLAATMLADPNPDGRPNTDVVKQRANGQDVARGSRDLGWIIDFGTDRQEADAALYAMPFDYVREHVKPTRVGNPRRTYRERWWLHAEPRPGMRAAIAGLSRYIATPPLSKHRIFAWLPASVLPDHQLVVFAREDDYTMGVLHSRVHEVWTRATATQLREIESGLRYTPSSCFDTFAFPEPEDATDELIAKIASELVKLRDGYLAGDPGRTLTGLYNTPPSWLTMAHTALDNAVLAAYGLPADATAPVILAHLLGLNLERAGVRPGPELLEVDEAS